MKYFALAKDFTRYHIQQYPGILKLKHLK